MLFDDGLLKVLKGHRMAKATATNMQSSPLFLPVRGTKQDRRDKKRKLNVAALFGKKLKGNLPIEKRSMSPKRKVAKVTPADSPVTDDSESFVPKRKATKVATPTDSPVSNDTDCWLPT